MKMTSKKYSISVDLDNITERQIALLDQENTNGLGWDYYCSGRITQAIVSNNRISGVVRELADEYQVEIVAHENEISSKCSCGYREGVCNHVVALLYCWVNDRENFINMGTLVGQLQHKDKQELIEIIERIFEDDPAKARHINQIENDNDMLESGEFDL